jgi:hypothetical protein
VTGLRNPAVLIHAGLVIFLIALLSVLDLIHPDDPPDANIGAGLVGLVIGALALPWSVSYLAWDYLFGETEGRLPVIVVCLGAVLNVAIHAALWARHARRTGGQGPWGAG